MARYTIRPAACFHSLTPLYDIGCSLLGLGSSFKEWLVDLGEVEGGHRVLDLGCGTGVLARGLVRSRPDISLFLADPDPGGLQRAGRGLQEFQIRRCLAMGEQLPFRTGSFDRVFSTLAAHHVPDRYRYDFFSEVRRVLATRGVFLYADFENHRRTWIPARFRSEKSLPEWLIDSGFDAELVGHRRGVHVYRATAFATGGQ